MTDELVSALRDLTDALERNRGRIDRARDNADDLIAAREAGRTWTQIVDQYEGTLVIELIGQNLEELYSAGGRVRRSLARALYEEGLSMERIARLFGVTRQRVSALLRAESGDASAPGGASATAEFVESGERL